MAEEVGEGVAEKREGDGEAGEEGGRDVVGGGDSIREAGSGGGEWDGMEVEACGAEKGGGEAGEDNGVDDDGGVGAAGSDEGGNVDEGEVVARGREGEEEDFESGKGCHGQRWKLFRVSGGEWRGRKEGFLKMKMEGKDGKLRQEITAGTVGVGMEFFMPSPCQRLRLGFYESLSSTSSHLFC